MGARLEPWSRGIRLLSFSFAAPRHHRSRIQDDSRRVPPDRASSFFAVLVSIDRVQCKFRHYLCVPNVCRRCRFLRLEFGIKERPSPRSGPSHRCRGRKCSHVQAWLPLHTSKPGPFSGGVPSAARVRSDGLLMRTAEVWKQKKESDETQRFCRNGSALAHVGNRAHQEILSAMRMCSPTLENLILRSGSGAPNRKKGELHQSLPCQLRLKELGEQILVIPGVSMI